MIVLNVYFKPAGYNETAFPNNLNLLWKSLYSMVLNQNSRTINDTPFCIILFSFYKLFRQYSMGILHCVKSNLKMELILKYYDFIQ